MRVGSTGILTKIIVLALIIYMATSLLDLRGQVLETQQVYAQLEASISTVNLENQRMQEAIASSDDPDTMEQAARDQGFVKVGETLYIDIAS